MSPTARRPCVPARRGPRTPVPSARATRRRPLHAPPRGARRPRSGGCERFRSLPRPARAPSTPSTRRSSAAARGTCPSCGAPPRRRRRRSPSPWRSPQRARARRRRAVSSAARAAPRPRREPLRAAPRSDSSSWCSASRCRSMRGRSARAVGVQADAKRRNALSDLRQLLLDRGCAHVEPSWFVCSNEPRVVAAAATPLPGAAAVLPSRATRELRGERETRARAELVGRAASPLASASSANPSRAGVTGLRRAR